MNIHYTYYINMTMTEEEKQKQKLKLKQKHNTDVSNYNYVDYFYHRALLDSFNLSVGILITAFYIFKQKN
jgi:hypothetical protein